jgi:hypothetical protein
MYFGIMIGLFATQTAKNKTANVLLDKLMQCLPGFRQVQVRHCILKSRVQHSSFEVVHILKNFQSLKSSRTTVAELKLLLQPYAGPGTGKSRLLRSISEHRFRFNGVQPNVRSSTSSRAHRIYAKSSDSLLLVRAKAAESNKQIRGMAPYRDEHMLIIAPGSQTTHVQLGLPESLAPAQHKFATRMFLAPDGKTYEPYKIKATKKEGFDEEELVEYPEDDEGAIWPLKGNASDFISRGVAGIAHAPVVQHLANN